MARRGTLNQAIAFSKEAAQLAAYSYGEKSAAASVLAPYAEDITKFGNYLALDR